MQESTRIERDEGSKSKLRIAAESAKNQAALILPNSHRNDWMLDLRFTRGIEDHLKIWDRRRTGMTRMTYKEHAGLNRSYSDDYRSPSMI